MFDNCNPWVSEACGSASARTWRFRMGPLLSALSERPDIVILSYKVELVNQIRRYSGWCATEWVINKHIANGRPPDMTTPRATAHLRLRSCRCIRCFTPWAACSRYAFGSRWCGKFLTCFGEPTLSLGEFLTSGLDPPFQCCDLSVPSSQVVRCCGKLRLKIILLLCRLALDFGLFPGEPIPFGPEVPSSVSTDACVSRACCMRRLVSVSSAVFDDSSWLARLTTWRVAAS